MSQAGSRRTASKEWLLEDGICFVFGIIWGLMSNCQFGNVIGTPGPEGVILHVVKPSL